MPDPLSTHVRFIKHQGKDVLIVEASHCDRDLLQGVLKEYFDTLRGLARGLKVRVLVNYEGSDHDAQLATLWKSELPLLNERVQRSACVGMSPLNLVAAQVYRKSAELMGQAIGEERGVIFEDRESALNWLTS